MTSLQEDVLKLKLSMGKVSKSTLTLVASGLEAVDYYKEIIYRFTREMPMVSKWSPLIDDYMGRMQNLKYDESGVGVLKEATNDLCAITEALRPNLVKSFVHTVISSSMTFAGKCIRNELQGGSREVITGQVQAVLSELSILFPRDEKLATQSEELALHVQALYTTTQVEKMESLAGKFMGDDEEGDWPPVPKRLALLKQLSDLCAIMPVTALQQAQARTELFSKFFDAVVLWLQQNFFESKGGADWASLETFVKLLGKITEIFQFGSASQKVFLDCLSVATTMVVKAKTLMPGQEISEQDMMAESNVKEMIKALMRSVLSMNAAETKMSKQEEMASNLCAAWDGAKTFKQWAMKIVETGVAQMQSRAQKHLDKVMTELSRVAGGKRNGTMWTDAWDKNVSWKSIAARVVEGSLFDIDASLLPVQIEDCVKAMTSQNPCYHRHLWN